MIIRYQWVDLFELAGKNKVSDFSQNDAEKILKKKVLEQVAQASVFYRLNKALDEINSSAGDTISIYLAGDIVQTLFKEVTVDGTSGLSYGSDNEIIYVHESLRIPIVYGIHFSANMHGGIADGQRKQNNGRIKGDLGALFIKSTVLQHLLMVL